MPLGIRLTVDFAFKKSFGSPENAPALIGLLNAILDLEVPIDEVTIMNPFSYQEFKDDKQIVLDIRCRDAAGRWLNVEMQVSRRPQLLKRLLYYASSMYVDQLKTGHDYAELTSAISICLLDKPFFLDSDQAHHRFQMVDTASGREIPEATEVHTVELTKYDIGEETIATKSKLHQWVFLLLRSQEYDAAELRRLLPDIEFQPAITTLHAISTKTRDRQMYDQREKARRDYQWEINGAREDGRREGREEGREEGELIGTIRALQEVLGEPVASREELQEKSIAALQAQTTELRQRITNR